MYDQKLNYLGYIFVARSVGLTLICFDAFGPKSTKLGEIRQNNGRRSRPFKITDFCTNGE